MQGNWADPLSPLPRQISAQQRQAKSPLRTSRPNSPAPEVARHEHLTVAFREQVLSRTFTTFEEFRQVLSPYRTAAGFGVSESHVVRFPQFKTTGKDQPSVTTDQYNDSHATDLTSTATDSHGTTGNASDFALAAQPEFTEPESSLVDSSSTALSGSQVNSRKASAAKNLNQDEGTLHSLRLDALCYFRMCS